MGLGLIGAIGGAGKAAGSLAQSTIDKELEIEKERRIEEYTIRKENRAEQRAIATEGRADERQIATEGREDERWTSRNEITHGQERDLAGYRSGLRRGDARYEQSMREQAAERERKRRAGLISGAMTEETAGYQDPANSLDDPDFGVDSKTRAGMKDVTGIKLDHRKAADVLAAEGYMDTAKKVLDLDPAYAASKVKVNPRADALRKIYSDRIQALIKELGAIDDYDDNASGKKQEIIAEIDRISELSANAFGGSLESSPKPRTPPPEGGAGATGVPARVEQLLSPGKRISLANGQVWQMSPEGKIERVR